MTVRRRLVPAVAAAAVLLGTVAVLPTSAASSPACPPARVAGLSYLLDAFQTGSSVGPGVAYGVVETVLGTPLPGPLGTAQNALLNAGASAVRTMSTAGPAQIQSLRSDVEMLAVYNTYSNALIELGATSMDSFATQSASAIQPFDLTVHQMATIFRQTEEQEQPCASVNARAATGRTLAGQIGFDFVSGQGKQAAALIRSHHLTGDAATLGKAVYLGGIAAVMTKQFDEFSTAVAYALPHSGTSIATATQAFRAAATGAVQSGLTPTEGAVGGRTVTETYQAYASAV